MAKSIRYGGTLQENLLTLLCHSDDHGKAVASLVDPALFEGDYRIIAERAVDYWGKYSKAPRAHAADLVADILDDPRDRRAPTFRNILFEMLRLSEEINPSHVLERLRTFTRAQRFKALVLQSAERFEAQEELALPEIEEMWADLLRARDATFDPGLTLNDVEHFVQYFESKQVEFTIGIEELDSRGIVPYRGAVLLFLAATGLGKSWFFIHIAKRAIMQRKKVLYITLEMSAEEVQQRCYQSFFGAATRPLAGGEGFRIPTLEKDEYKKLAGIGEDTIVPEFTLRTENLLDELSVRRDLMRGKFANLMIKRFPTRGLTVGQLRGYLDAMESTTGFVPDVLILDYIGIMRTDAKDHRISLGRTFEDFRGLCVERNLAGLTAQQISREGAKAKRAGKVNVSEDWSLIGTSDICITLSATQAEQRFGFACLHVDKARSERDQSSVLITQNYATGQFVLDSAPLDNRYEDLFDPKGLDDGSDDDRGD